MSDPQPPENMPARPPLPPQAGFPAEPQLGADAHAAGTPDESTAAAPQFTAPSGTATNGEQAPLFAPAGDGPQAPRSADAPGAASRTAPTFDESPVFRSAPAYDEPQAPPPNPFGQQAAAARHAPPRRAPASELSPGETQRERSSGFAPPSSPGFGAPAAPAPANSAAYAPAPLAAGYPQYGQQAPPALPFPQPGYSAPGYAGSAYAGAQGQPSATPAAGTPGSAAEPAARLATTGLVLGVIGVVGGIFFGWTLLLSVAAIVLGFLARSRESHARGVALGAIVTGIVGVLLSVGWLAYSILTWLALTAT